MSRVEFPSRILRSNRPSTGPATRPETLRAGQSVTKQNPIVNAERIAQLRRELSGADQHVVEGVANIAKQVKLIADLERLGNDIAAAESLLVIFEEIQQMHQQHRQTVTNELNELDPPADMTRQPVAPA